MTIQKYLQELDEVIDLAPEVRRVEILRRSIWDTGMECVAIYRYKLTMIDGSLLELSERLVEMETTLTITKYRHHWQNQHAQIIKRWDNAPHHRHLATFPDHVHDGAENNVLEHQAASGLEILRNIISIMADTR